MFTVRDTGMGDHYCVCNSFTRAHVIALALRLQSEGSTHFMVLLHDEEVKFDTRNGHTGA